MLFQKDQTTFLITSQNTFHWNIRLLQHHTSCHAHKHTSLRQSQVTSYWSPNPALSSSPNIVSSSCCLRCHRVLIATPCQRQSRADNPHLISINLPVPVLIKTAQRSHCLSHLSAPQPGTGRSQCSPNKSNKGDLGIYTPEKYQMTLIL